LASAVRSSRLRNPEERTVDTTRQEWLDAEAQRERSSVVAVCGGRSVIVYSAVWKNLLECPFWADFYDNWMLPLCWLLQNAAFNEGFLWWL
jgi:hypothetical protein